MSDLAQCYADLSVVIGEMADGVYGEDWRIDQDVADCAQRKVIPDLIAQSFPPAKLFTHGPSSVVFTWDRPSVSYYLTVSASMFSALISGPDTAPHLRLDDTSLGSCLEILSKIKGDRDAG